MNKELQKILNQMEATLELWKTLKNVKDSYLEFREKDIKLLYDYITNLQEENERLKHNLEQLYNDTKDTYNEICAKQIDYKSRNEKAIELIKENCIDDEFYVNLTKKEKCIYDVLNILEGSDKE